MPSSAVNSRTPQCEFRSAAAFWTSKSIGYSICRDAAEKTNNFLGAENLLTNEWEKLLITCKMKEVVCA
jgi:hypothetical protein